MMTEAFDVVSSERRSLLKGSAALAGLWPWSFLERAVGREGAGKFSSGRGVETVHHGNVALIALNRPREDNHLDERDWADVLAAFQAANEDVSIRSIVLAAHGKNFSKGIAASQSQIEEVLATGTNAGNAKRLSTKPLVAAVQGQAAGLGIALLLAADVRITSAEAVLSWPDPRHADIFRPLLSREIGRGNAQRFLLTGDRLDAHEAWRLGLVQQLSADHAEALEEAMSIAQAIARRQGHRHESV